MEVEALPLERPITYYMDGPVSAEDTLVVKSGIRRCLRLDPTKRATVQELLENPWWQSAG